MQIIIGWDIGGAHLKAARAEDGIITHAAQVPSPLWLGLEELDCAFAQAQAIVGRAPLNAITMTGELCDAFATREEGVVGLAGAAERLLAPGAVWFYAGRSGFVGAPEIAAHASDIASANWHASAALSGHRAPQALFIDMGSSTTDIIPIAGSRPAALGYADAARLGHGELVYTGLVRTFLMAGPKLVPFAGQWTPLMNEWFADMADVHRILGQLPAGADLTDTADGREKTAAASRARLARMIGRDSCEADAAAWDRLARFFAEAQLREIMDAAALVLSRSILDAGAPIVGAGVGRGVIRQIAHRFERPFVAFDELIEALPEARSKACDCAPACAAALVAAAQFSA
ncbi:hydantoinase/oxoprolinase family protein [Methylocapsa aurea]|uniref:hydantoinase/oxoprolinase family protein n=1 Tax=Methylocapsa aurea TaxID=663610 RepID=UPI00056D1D9B|nr:hydantoinase/oxoprolinase family protein [Methylocapsa aurea]